MQQNAFSPRKHYLYLLKLVRYCFYFSHEIMLDILVIVSEAFFVREDRPYFL